MGYSNRSVYLSSCNISWSYKTSNFVDKLPSLKAEFLVLLGFWSSSKFEYLIIFDNIVISCKSAHIWNVRFQVLCRFISITQNRPPLKKHFLYLSAHGRIFTRFTVKDGPPHTRSNSYRNNHLCVFLIECFMLLTNLRMQHVLEMWLQHYLPSTKRFRQQYLQPTYW